MGSGGHIALGVLVTTAMTRFKKALEILHLREKSNYHQTACMKVLDFKDSVAGRRESINKQLDKSLKSQIENNRKVFKSTMATVEFCGRQGIALRGHRNDSTVMKEETFTGNHGNFQSLLQFRCDAGDIGLKEHMSTCGGNVTYRSKNIQNEVVEVLGSVIKMALIDKVKEAKFVSVLCDEVQDVSSTEQVTFIIRYFEQSQQIL